jgi:hypothetical protein
MGRLANHPNQLHARPANMSSKQPNSNSLLRDRLYGEHYPDSFLDVPGPIRKPSVATLGDYIKQLSEVGNEPNERCFACEPNKPSESHQCPNNPILTCNCADNKFCAEQPNDNGWFTCPDSGKLCNVLTCPDGCKGDRNDDKCPNHDGFSDNLDYVGNPVPTKQQLDKLTEDTVYNRTQRQNPDSGRNRFIARDICETGASAAKHILRTTAGEWATERMADAGLSDGPYDSTNH